MASASYQFKPIGVVRSCFKEKFGIPRQPGLAPEARATLELTTPFNRSEALFGLEGFSHIWVIFVFHQTMRDGWRPTVRPPRLGGNRRVGVFASRSPFRPNPIGLSVVELERIECSNGECVLYLRGADLVDGTPVLDIKPYVAYADALPESVDGYAVDYPARSVSITFSELADRQCAEREAAGTPGLRQLIGQVLAQDPRPAYFSNGQPADDGQAERRCFGMRLYDFDLRWNVDSNGVSVLELRPISDGCVRKS
jgi:tRNA-Thr(GGU) m(6)t(6)A37 methyltransferase TsaA